ncbi:MAG TPA: YqgQ family protein [Bacillota bacterium]|nr:YqgQ family protein [Compostibacillus humi]HLT56310.1 YqgQ family protein [Bacillota bacterium]
METFYDVQQLLKKFGTIIYTKDRLGDIELMDMEVDELYQFQLISRSDYMQAKLILRKEKRKLSSNSSGKGIIY